MERRKFIGLVSAGTVAVVAGGYIGFSNFEKVVRKIIVEDTGSLKIQQNEIDRFMADAHKKGAWEVYSLAKQQFIKWSFYFENPLFQLPYAVKYNRYRSEIVGLFLLSTTFFNNKMDTGVPVRYTSLYDPYFTPCSNPFSNLFYP